MHKNGGNGRKAKVHSEVFMILVLQYTWLAASFRFYLDLPSQSISAPPELLYRYLSVNTFIERAKKKKHERDSKSPIL